MREAIMRGWMASTSTWKGDKKVRVVFTLFFYGEHAACASLSASVMSGVGWEPQLQKGAKYSIVIVPCHQTEHRRVAGNLVLPLP